MTESDDDALIDGALSRVTEEQWRALWDAAERVAAEDEHVTWGGGPSEVDAPPGGNGSDGEARTFQMPYAIYSDAVNALQDAAHSAGLIVPFDWPAWDGTSRYRAGVDMHDAAPGDAVRMITAVMRSERFGEGSISTALEDGTLQAAIERLRGWHSTRLNQ